MTEIVSRFVIETQKTAEIVAAWFEKAPASRLYLMTEIIEEATGIAGETKDAERLAPIVGRLLAELGMTCKRMRGPQGNRRYWVK